MTLFELLKHVVFMSAFIIVSSMMLYAFSKGDEKNKLSNGVSEDEVNAIVESEGKFLFAFVIEILIIQLTNDSSMYHFEMYHFNSNYEVESVEYPYLNTFIFFSLLNIIIFLICYGIVFIKDRNKYNRYCRSIKSFKGLVIILGLLSVFRLATAFDYENIENNESKDHYLGVYEDGRKAYLLTDTIKYYSDPDYGEFEGYTCAVKAVHKNSNNYDIINYNYRIGQTVNLSRDGKWLFNIRDMHKIYDNPEINPEAKLCIYLRDKLENKFNEYK